MVKPTIAANAVTTVAGAAYIICRILTLIIPDAMFTILHAWVHTLNVSALKANAGVSFGDEVWGFIALVIFVWLFVYASATLYNKWVK